MDQASLIVLGAFLALITSILMEWLRGYFANRRTKRLVRELLKGEIPELLDTISRLIVDFGKLGYVSYKHLEEIQNTRQGYERNRDWIVLFKGDFRSALTAFYRSLSSVVRDAYSVENLRGNPEQRTFVDNQSNSLLTRFHTILVDGKQLQARLDKS